VTSLLGKVIDKCRECCTPQKNDVFEQYKFFQLTQAIGESIDSFAAALRLRVKDCGLGDQTESLISDRIVFGCVDTQVAVVGVSKDIWRHCGLQPQRWCLPSLVFDTSLYIIDGDALFQAMVRLPETFEALALYIFKSLPAAKTVHFVTDTYVESSIKQPERQRRGTSPTFLIGGEKTKLPRDFKSFLLNSDNKWQLTRFLLKEWQSVCYARHLFGRSVLFVCENECVCLQSEDSLTVTATPALELYSDQEEVDTCIVLHSLHAAARTTSSDQIVVSSPDTDVFILLLYYSRHIPNPLVFETGCGNNRRLLDVHHTAKYPFTPSQDATVLVHLCEKAKNTIPSPTS